MVSVLSAIVHDTFVPHVPRCADTPAAKSVETTKKNTFFIFLVFITRSPHTRCLFETWFYYLHNLKKRGNCTAARPTLRGLRIARYS